MPPASFKGAECSGHTSYPITKISTASDNCNINNNGAARSTDLAEMHISITPSPPDNPHLRKLGKGSADIFINDLSAIRIGDPVVSDTAPCGGHVQTGSDNVIFN